MLHIVDVFCIVFLDYNCEEHNNPPDFFLDVLSGCIPSSNLRSSASKESVEKRKEPTDRSSYISNGRFLLAFLPCSLLMRLD